jgi:hypothetical protein
MITVPRRFCELTTGIQSQILAELDFPPSGLSGLEGVVPLPLAPDSRTNPHHREYQSFLLALISMRRLLNRIHYHMYNQGKYICEHFRPV